MLDQRIVAFRLPSGLPALAAAEAENHGFAAVDGQEKAVYVFSAAGVFQQAYETVRPYEQLHRSSVSPTAGTYLATGRCPCGRRIYLLNCRFEEMGSIDVHPYPDCDCEDVGEIMDAFPTAENDSARIHVAFRRSVREFDYNGTQLRMVSPAEEGRLNLHYAISGPAHALHFRKKDTEFINLAELGAVYLGTLPDSMILRGFLPRGFHDLYGVFGYRYLYNYLLPIYQNGQLVLPSGSDMEHILQNLCPCP